MPVEGDWPTCLRIAWKILDKIARLSGSLSSRSLIGFKECWACAFSCCNTAFGPKLYCIYKGCTCVTPFHTLSLHVN